MARGILVAQPEIKPAPPALEAQILFFFLNIFIGVRGFLTTGLPGKSLNILNMLKF